MFRKRHWLIEYSPTWVLAALVLCPFVIGYFVLTASHTCPHCKMEVKGNQWNHDMDCCIPCTLRIIHSLDDMNKGYLELQRLKREGP
jgi:hypothetical protein